MIPSHLHRKIGGFGRIFSNVASYFSFVPTSKPTLLVNAEGVVSLVLSLLTISVV